MLRDTVCSELILVSTTLTNSYHITHVTSMNYTTSKLQRSVVKIYLINLKLTDVSHSVSNRFEFENLIRWRCRPRKHLRGHQRTCGYVMKKGVNQNNSGFIKVYGVRIPFYYTTISLKRNINMICSFIYLWLLYCIFVSSVTFKFLSNHFRSRPFRCGRTPYLLCLWNASLHDFSFWCIRLKYIVSHSLTVLLSKVLNYPVKQWCSEFEALKWFTSNHDELWSNGYNRSCFMTI